jgi:transcriptional regulator with XRE-family HTH domain
MESSIKNSSNLIDGILNSISIEEKYHIEQKMLLAAKIDKLREGKGWSKVQFAKEMNKKPSEITKWLSGTHNFTLDTLLDIQNIFSVNLVNTSDKPVEQVVHFYYSINIQAQNPQPCSISDLLSEKALNYLPSKKQFHYQSN